MLPSRPTHFQSRVLWSALTGIALAVVGALAIGLVLLIGKVLAYLQPVLVPLAAAGVLAYLLDPLVGKLENRGNSRLRSIIYVFGSAALLLIITLLVISPRIIKEAGELYAKKEQIATSLVLHIRTTPWLRDLSRQAFEEHVEEDATGKELTEKPGLGEEISGYDTWLSEFPRWTPGINASEFNLKKTKAWHWVTENSNNLLSTGLGWLQGGAGKVFGFIGYALGFLLVPVYLFYFLKETSTIKSRWSQFVPLRESKLKREIVATLGEMNSYLIAFFRGQVLVSLINGILTGLLLWAIGLPYALVIGIALAILGVMPFIGFLLALIPALIISVATYGDWQHPALVLAVFFAVQQVDGIFLQPKIIGDKVGLHPMTIIFSIFFWSLLLGGFLGALLAIPLTASVKVLFTRYIWGPGTTEEEEAPADTATNS